jgi:hypothetical protein
VNQRAVSIGNASPARYHARMADSEIIERFVPERWLEPDSRMKLFANIDLETGQVTATSAADWLRLTSIVSLHPPVPPNIINLFEQARACAVYGYFFYPLYALAVEHVVRVADAAVKSKCEQLAAPRKQARDFEDRIDWLAGQLGVPLFDKARWHMRRKWRNEVTHQTQRTILTPVSVGPIFNSIAEDIQALFGGADETFS